MGREKEKNHKILKKNKEQKFSYYYFKHINYEKQISLYHLNNLSIQTC